MKINDKIKRIKMTANNFWHNLAYKAYPQYLHIAQRNENLLFITLVLSMISVMLHNHTLILLVISLMNILVILAYIFAMRSHYIRRLEQGLKQHFDLNELLLRFYDYAPYDFINKQATIVFTLFPNLNLFYLYSINKTKRNELWKRSIKRLAQIMATYQRNNQDNTNYTFLITLPEWHNNNQFKRLFNQNNLKLHNVDDVYVKTPPTRFTYGKYKLGLYPKDWHIYEVVISNII